MLVRFVSRFLLVPLTKFYLRKDRWYRFKGIRLKILKGVFHPGLFFSTRYLLSELEDEDLKGKNILELGAGSGLISFYAAKRGAKVTATDVSTVALKGMSENQARLGTKVSILESDLFYNIPQQEFDLIIINPPYYPKDPENEADKAWYCGFGFTYFEKLFKEIGPWMQPNTRVWLSLSGDCDLYSIEKIAQKYGLRLEQRSEKRYLWEMQFIYLIKPYI